MVINALEIEQYFQYNQPSLAASRKLADPSPAEVVVDSGFTRDLKIE